MHAVSAGGSLAYADRAGAPSADEWAQTVDDSLVLAFEQGTAELSAVFVRVIYAVDSLAKKLAIAVLLCSENYLQKSLLKTKCRCLRLNHSKVQHGRADWEYQKSRGQSRLALASLMLGSLCPSNIKKKRIIFGCGE